MGDGSVKIRRKTKIRRYIVLFAAGTLLIWAAVSAGRGLVKNIELRAESILTARAVNIMNTSIKQALKEYGGMRDFLMVEKDNDGHITLLSADSQAMNEIALNSTIKTQEALDNAENVTIGIPLGDVFLSYMLAGMGPDITISAAPVGEIETKYRTSFASAGINQTKFNVSIIQEVELKMIIGFSSFTVPVKTEIPVCETIVVGVVPEVYANLREEADILNLLP